MTKKGPAPLVRTPCCGWSIDLEDFSRSYRSKLKKGTPGHFWSSVAAHTGQTGRAQFRSPFEPLEIGDEAGSLPGSALVDRVTVKPTRTAT